MAHKLEQLQDTCNESNAIIRDIKKMLANYAKELSDVR
jgi:hypothetical protein